MSKGNRDRARRRDLPPTNPASALLRAMDGAEFPGGCDQCDAYQTITADRYGPNVHALTVHHDADCPVLARAKAGRR